MNKEKCLEVIQTTRIVPAIRAESEEQALLVAKALQQGGVGSLEVTMAVPGADKVIAKLAAAYPQLAIGAGTVLDAYSAQKAVDAGASFIVGPCFREDIIEVCKRYGVLSQMGALTPSEVLNAYQAGADVVKLFPISELGPSYLKGVKAILPQIPIVVVGGINLDNFISYIKAGACAVGVASALVNPKLVKEGKFDEITATAEKFVNAIKEL